MAHRCFVAALLLAAGLCTITTSVQAFDESKYPDWKGKWERETRPRWVQEGDKAPLTPEYQAIYQANLAEQYLKKGDEVAIEGKLSNKSYVDKDGNKRYVSEVVVNEFLKVGGKN